MFAAAFEGQSARWVKYVILANIALYLLVLLTGGSSSFLNTFFALNGPRFLSGNFHQLATYMWMHGGVMHLAFNMLGLFFFGREVARHIGAGHFLALYVAGGLAGGILWLIFNFNSPSIMVGASGAVLGLVTAFATIRPRAEVYLFPIPMPVQARWMAVGYAVLTLLMIAENHSNIAHLAHLGGMVVGFAYIKMIGAALEPMFHHPPAWAENIFKPQPLPPQPEHKPGPTKTNTAHPRPKPSHTSETNPHEFISNKIDPILDKISKHGFQSLSPQERKLLEEARKKL